jgi:hypothetical protein
LTSPDEPEERVEPARSEAHERARKIKPIYTEGELVTVAGARNQAEAELIQGMLLEEGIPSILRRTAGFDVPDFLAAGPRDVLVPAAGAEAAQELLVTSDMAPTRRTEPDRPLRRALVLTTVILAVGGATALVAWLLQAAG